jgi:hypothetical protein
MGDQETPAPIPNPTRSVAKKFPWSLPKIISNPTPKYPPPRPCQVALSAFSTHGGGDSSCGTAQWSRALYFLFRKINDVANALRQSLLTLMTNVVQPGAERTLAIREVCPRLIEASSEFISSHERRSETDCRRTRSRTAKGSGKVCRTEVPSGTEQRQTGFCAHSFGIGFCSPWIRIPQKRHDANAYS